MLQGANSTSKAVAWTSELKSKNARASLANVIMLFPPGTAWRRGWCYTRLYRLSFLVCFLSQLKSQT